MEDLCTSESRGQLQVCTPTQQVDGRRILTERSAAFLSASANGKHADFLPESISVRRLLSQPTLQKEPPGSEEEQMLTNGPTY